MGTVSNWTGRDLSLLAGLDLRNEPSFVVRRFVQRFLAGEMTAREAIARIRSHLAVRDEDPYPNDWPDTWIGRAIGCFAASRKPLPFGPTTQHRRAG